MCSEPAEADTSSAAAAAATTSTGPGARHQERSAGHQAAAVNDLPAPLALAMQVHANLRYHEDRQAYFERMSRWTNFIVVVTGSSAATAGFAQWPAGAAASGVITALVGAAQLVFDFSGKARSHLELRNGFIRLLAKVERPGADLADLRVRMTRRYEGEFELYHAVNALAYNAAQLAFGRSWDTLLVVGWWQRLMRHVIRFDPSVFKTKEEIAAEGADRAR